MTRPSDTERWSFGGAFPIEEYKQITREELEADYMQNGPATWSAGPVPRFLEGLPLYSSVEDFLVEGIKSVVSSKAVNLSREPENRRRKDTMSYTMAWDSGKSHF